MFFYIYIFYLFSHIIFVIVTIVDGVNFIQLALKKKKKNFNTLLKIEPSVFFPVLLFLNILTFNINESTKLTFVNYLIKYVS